MSQGEFRFNILGPLELERSGRLVELGTFRQRSLLALLLINHNQVVSTDRILDELWGEEGSGRQNALWVHISHLRSALEPERASRSQGSVLLTRPPGYMLSVDPLAVDAVEFEHLLAEGRGLLTHDPAAAALTFSEALALWRGKALQEFAYESFAQTELRRLDALRLDAVEGRIDADLRRGMGHQLVGELEGLVTEHPYREQLTGQLMTALYRSRRRAEALRAYDNLAARLRTELGVDPSPALQDMLDQVLQGDPRLDPGVSSHVSGELGLGIRGYELRSVLASDDFGTSYLGYQAAIGREVAIKVVKPELANDPGFVRSFESRAGIIASIDSPAMVPIYDYWREPGGAFLVEKLVVGDDLRSAIIDGPAAPAQVLEMVEDLAEPLMRAHSLGVKHGSVGPETVVVSDGHTYLTGFGIGGEEVSVRDDVTGLAGCAAHMLAGRLGPPLEVLEGVDHPMAGVLVQALTLPGLESVQDLVDALRHADGAPPPSEETKVANPYRGLHAFEESDQGVFFGRDRLVERMLARLGGPGSEGRFLAVVGPSGSGKSSVVRAGLVPALRAGAVPGSQKWFLVSMTPGSRPFESLERALLSIAGDEMPTLLEKLRVGPDGLRRVVDAVSPDRQSPMLLLIDQFEEMYTLASDADRDLFSAALHEAVTHPRSRLKVVITIRADFYDHPLRSSQLAELLREHTELVTPMGVRDLERAIDGPAQSVGVVVEPALLATLTAEAVREPSSLPLLQYTLTELFERRSGHTLTLQSLDDIGGVTGALVGRAEALFADLDAEARSITPDIFLRMVSVNEVGAETRRRVLVSELLGIADDGGSAIDDTLRSFSRHRLLTFDRDPVSRAPTVELAHEFLLTAWGRLARWIDRAREDLHAHRRLSGAVREWVSQDRDPDFLLGGASLGRFESWVSSPPVRLTVDENAFLEAAVEAERSRRQVAETQARDRESLRRRTRALFGLVTGSVVLVVLAVVAFTQRERAEDFAALISSSAHARLLITQSGLSLEEDPALAVALAIEAIRATEESGEVLPEAVDALHWAIQQATIQYPADDQDLPVTVRLHSSGPRGVFVLPPAELVALAQAGIDREFTADECSRFFPGLHCPDPEVPIRDVAIAGGIEAYMAANSDGPLLAGTEVIFTSGWAEDMAAAARDDLTALGAGLGIEVIHRFARPDESHSEFGSIDDPGDLVWVGAPAYLHETLERRPLVDVGTYLGEGYLRQSFGSHMMSLVQVDGNTYGVPAAIDAKSHIWFDPVTFEGHRYEEPQTWEELLALSDQMVQDGVTPWCLGVGSGEATGWPATDWLEHFVLSTEGPEFYDRWVAHEVPFDHPAVVAALEKVGAMARTPGYVLPGSISDRGWDEAISAGSGIPPECVLIPMPPWARDLSAGADLEPMRFPAVTSRYASAVEGGMGAVSVVFDRPETRAVLRALAGPSWGENMARQLGPGWFYPAHRGFDIENFVDPTRRELAAALAEANRLDMFRFDASDRIPFDIGFTALNTALTEYLSDPEVAATDALAKVEQAWVAFEAAG